MELVHGTHSKASRFVAEDDVISRLPKNLITSILDCLPIRDAVRTGILARNWRFKWTMLSQLVFDEKFFKDVLGAQGTNSYDWRKVITFLLHLKGSIMKLTLCLPKDMVFDVEDINHWFLFLSGKGLKDVTLENMHETPLKLPGHLFSCLELKRLKIVNCCFHPPLVFEPAEIAKPELVNCSTIIQLVGSFSKLQEVNLSFEKCKLLAEGCARKGVTTTFPCLKTLKLLFMNFNKDIEGISFILKMICCSPQLQTLKILASYANHVPPLALCSSDFDDNIMCQLQLQNVVFACFKGSESEIYLIKSLLAHSPVLKKISIGLYSSLVVGGADGRLQFAEKLLKLHRASPVAEIDLFYVSKSDSSSLKYYLSGCL